MKIKDLLLPLLILMVTATHLQKVNIIPQPNEMNLQRGYFTFIRLQIHANSESQSTANYLLKELQKVSRKSYQIRINKKLSSNYISFDKNQTLSKEAYELIITDNGISITASGPTGWFYGVQGLLQIFNQYEKNRGQTTSLPKLAIKDQPAFKWRAYMLHEARHFKGPNQVKLLLDEMAYLKMNTFHWHLIDDQGWRIEIKKYPLLTKIGSKRKSTQIGPKQWESPIQSGEPHEGFYTQEKIKEIIAYAHERHITIVPEIEMPGHSTAAITSSSFNKPIPKTAICFSGNTNRYTS